MQGIRTDQAYSHIINYVKTCDMISVADFHEYLRLIHKVKSIHSRSRLITKFCDNEYIKRYRAGKNCYLKFMRDYAK